MKIKNIKLISSAIDRSLDRVEQTHPRGPTPLPPGDRISTFNLVNYVVNRVEEEVGGHQRETPMEKDLRVAQNKQDIISWAGQYYRVLDVNSSNEAYHRVPEALKRQVLKVKFIEGTCFTTMGQIISIYGTGDESEFVRLTHELISILCQMDEPFGDPIERPFRGAIHDAFTLVRHNMRDQFYQEVKLLLF